jgi:hypothetical protein
LDRRERFLLALLPVALFAFNPIWTYETTLAEVYSWHVAWVLGASLYFVRLVRALADEEDWPARRLYGRAALWGLLCGVGGAHHATSIFVAAPLSIAILVALIARRRRGAAPATTALAATALAATVLVATCVPLLSYGIILWRSTHPAPIQWWGLTPGLQGLLRHASGMLYGGSTRGCCAGTSIRSSSPACWSRWLAPCAPAAPASERSSGDSPPPPCSGPPIRSTTAWWIHPPTSSTRWHSAPRR